MEFLDHDVRPKNADLVLIPVEWDATTSYGKGTAKAPERIAKASAQVDYLDPDFPKRISFLNNNDLNPEYKFFRDQSSKLLDLNVKHMKENPLVIDEVNHWSDKINEWVYTCSKNWLNQGKIVGVVGGDHSSPYGLIKALSEKHQDGFTIVHFDAHFDYRKAYQDFHHSHASIMRNISEDVQNVSFIHVGIRDYCKEEHDWYLSLEEKARAFHPISLEAFKIVLPNYAKEKVYISFDIDAFEQNYCPNTGTPVPGGITWNEMVEYFVHITDYRDVIGFDLCEVGDGEWDANVGARVLYKLCKMVLP